MASAREWNVSVSRSMGETPSRNERSVSQENSSWASTVPGSERFTPQCFLPRGALPGPGMGVVVDVAHLGARNIGVDLGSLEAGVAQQLLDGHQIQTALQKMGGEGMPQGVRRGFF